MSTVQVIDMMQRTVELNSTVSRIVSLVPSQTELLVDLGLKNQLVGITKFCIHPANLKNSVESIGGPKKLNIQKIRSLNPDLIIANKEENIREEIEELASEFPVWISDVNDLNEALLMIEQIGRITNTNPKANEIGLSIRAAFHQLISYQDLPKSVLYLIWKDPYMAVGKHTFIDDMIHRIGLINSIQIERYPEILPNTIEPDLVFLSSEPYPFSEKHLEEVQRCFPNSRLVLVDGEYFTWYGSRLIDSPAYFQKLLKSIESD